MYRLTVTELAVASTCVRLDLRSGFLFFTRFVERSTTFYVITFEVEFYMARSQAALTQWRARYQKIGTNEAKNRKRKSSETKYGA